MKASLVEVKPLKKTKTQEDSKKLHLPAVLVTLPVLVFVGQVPGWVDSSVVCIVVMSSADQLVLVSREAVAPAGHIVTLTLNNPKRLNSLSAPLIGALVEAIDAAARESGPLVVLICGAGRAFSAGVDLTAAGSIFALEATVDAAVFRREFDVCAALHACPHPVIACVAGPCFTGGLELALNCDMVLASSCALFSDTHAGVGIAPCWGMSQLLPRLIGIHRAMEMSLSASPVDAATAERWGLCNRVVPGAGSAAVVAAGRVRLVYA